jgi:hypothetical protein
MNEKEKWAEYEKSLATSETFLRMQVGTAIAALAMHLTPQEFLSLDDKQLMEWHFKPAMQQIGYMLRELMSRSAAAPDPAPPAAATPPDE